MMTKKRKAILAVCLAAMTAAPLAGCGGGSGSQTPPFGAAPNGFEGVFSLPYTSAEGDTALIQPGAVSAYGWDASVKPNVQIWYDNADSSTNLCMDTFEIQKEETRQGLDVSQRSILEFYSRIINTSRDYAGSDHISIYTLSGAHNADLQEAGNNNVFWAPLPDGSDPSKPEFYVRSLEVDIAETDANGAPTAFTDLNSQTYTVLSEGVLRQLYAEGGKISDESFASDLNVVFSDLQDVDLNATELGELIAARLKTARANGNDVTLCCVGVKLPYSGWICVPDRVHSLTSMTIYRQGYVYGQNRTYYFLISGPTAAAEQYTRNLIVSMGDRVRGDTQNTNGFAPQSLFVMDQPEESETGSGTAAPERVIRLVADPDAGTAKKAPQPKKGKDSSSEAPAETTTTVSEAPAQSDYKTSHFSFAEEADMLACFRGSDTGAIATYAEKQGLNWKQYMSCVYLEKEGAVSYPAELLSQLRNTETTEIVGAQLYRAALEKADKTGKEMNCKWVPVSESDFNATGNLVQLQNEVYVKFNKQAPAETYAWMLEIDMADKAVDDLSKLIDPAFLEKKYTTADVKNSSYFTAIGLNTFAETILGARDQRVTEKYYVLILLKHTPTLEKVNAKKNDSSAASAAS